MKLFAVALLFLVGCTTAPTTLNEERSLLRGLGDLGTTVVLDRAVDRNNLDATKQEITNITQSLINFLDTGDVKNLALSAMKTKLRSLIPTKYQSLLDASLLSMNLNSPDIDLNAKVGANNVYRFRALLQGVLNGTLEHLPEHGR